MLLLRPIPEAGETSRPRSGTCIYLPQMCVLGCLAPTDFGLSPTPVPRNHTPPTVKDASSTVETAGIHSAPPELPDNPAEGYYEWQKIEDGKKIPNYLYSENESLLGFAGLYEFWPALPYLRPPGQRGPCPTPPATGPGKIVVLCRIRHAIARSNRPPTRGFMDRSSQNWYPGQKVPSPTSTRSNCCMRGSGSSCMAESRSRTCSRSGRPNEYDSLIGAH